jgi:hypothetical protein
VVIPAGRGELFTRNRMGLEAENGLWQSGWLNTKEIVSILDIFLQLLSI